MTVNRTVVLTLSGLAMMASAPNAFAQNAASAHQDATAISDADIKAYAAVAAKVNGIQGNASLSEADKTAQTSAAVKGSGLDADKFNAITAASQADPQVRQKLHDAMAQRPGG
jgi:cell division septation protein DedD